MNAFKNLLLSTGLILGLTAAAKADLIAYWNFDEGTGITANDSTGNGNTGTLENGVAWTNNSISGNALYFDGLDDRVNIAKTPSVDLTNQVSLEAWINRSGSQDGTIFSRNGPFYLAVRNDKIWGGVYSGASPSWTEFGGTTTLQLGQWYKLNMTYDGSNVRLFVNGVQDGSSPASGNMPVISQQPWIGWGDPGQNQYFTGIIDNVKIYSTAISPVPEPSAVALGFLGAGALTLRQRRREFNSK